MAASADLQRELAELRETMELLGTSAPPVAPSTALRDRVLATRDPSHRLDGFRVRMQQLFDISAERAMKCSVSTGVTAILARTCWLRAALWAFGSWV